VARYNEGESCLERCSRYQLSEITELSCYKLAAKRVHAPSLLQLSGIKKMWIRRFSVFIGVFRSAAKFSHYNTSKTRCQKGLERANRTVLRENKPSHSKGFMGMFCYLSYFAVKYESFIAKIAGFTPQTAMFYCNFPYDKCGTYFRPFGRVEEKLTGSLTSLRMRTLL
jgi:hypothetical protein